MDWRALAAGTALAAGAACASPRAHTTEPCPSGPEAIDRIAAGIEALGVRQPALREFRRASALRGAFIHYENDVTLEQDPEYDVKLRAFEERVARTRMPSMRAAAEKPEPTRRRYGGQGLRLVLRFDGPETRGSFPLVVPPERQFGDHQLSLLDIEGPATEPFRRLDADLRATIDREIASFRHGGCR